MDKKINMPWRKIALKILILILGAFLISLYADDVIEMVKYTELGYMTTSVLGQDVPVNDEVLNELCKTKSGWEDDLDLLIKHTSDNMFYSYEFEYKQTDKPQFPIADFNKSPRFYDQFGQFISSCGQYHGLSGDTFEKERPWIEQWRSKQFCKNVLPKLNFIKYTCINN